MEASRGYSDRGLENQSKVIVAWRLSPKAIDIDFSPDASAESMREAIRRRTLLLDGDL